MVVLYKKGSLKIKFSKNNNNKFDQMEKIHESGCILTDCWKIFLADYVFPYIKIPGKIIY